MILAVLYNSYNTFNSTVNKIANTLKESTTYY